MKTNTFTFSFVELSLLERLLAFAKEYEINITHESFTFPGRLLAVEGIHDGIRASLTMGRGNEGLMKKVVCIGQKIVLF